MDDTGLLNAEVDLSALELPYSLRDLGWGYYRAHLRVWHEASGTEDATNPANLAHHVGGRDSFVELKPPTLNLCDELVTTDLVGTRFLSSLRGFTLSEHDDSHILARTVREGNSTPDHLVCMLGVDTETNRDVHALIWAVLNTQQFLFVQ